MTAVHPSDMRSRVDEGPEGLSITIPMRRSWWYIAFTPLWVGLWSYLFLGIRDGGPFANPPISSRVFFAIVVAVAAGQWLWELVGRERVTADPVRLTVRRELFGIGPRQEYDASEIARLRVSPEPVAQGGWRRRRARSVAFDYGARTVRFAPVDEAEARSIVALLSGRLHLRQQEDTTEGVAEPLEPEGEPDAPEVATFWGRG